MEFRGLDNVQVLSVFRRDYGMVFLILIHYNHRVTLSDVDMQNFMFNRRTLRSSCVCQASSQIFRAAFLFLRALQILTHLLPTIALRGSYFCYPHYTDEETEDSETTCSKSHRSWVTELGFNPRQCGF